jgi:predicted nucleic acid-binding protein
MTLVVDASIWVAAADARDPFSARSRSYLERVLKSGRPIALPAHAPLEVACSLARRMQDGAAGLDLAARLLQSPVVEVHALDGPFLEQAGHHGTNALFRAGDAIYAALAAKTGGGLVS